MKKVAKAGLVVLAANISLVAGGISLNKFDVKSAKVTYSIKNHMDIMGTKKDTIGKKRVIFDNNGQNTLTETSKVSKQNIAGKKELKKEHTMSYFVGNSMYVVNFKSKKILRMKNPAAAMMMMAGGKDLSPTDLMKKMGGKKIDTDKILGYTCDVWELMGTKQCLYKGVPLKIETNIMGTQIQIATKADFDISISKDDFKLPDFPIYGANGEKIDKSQLANLDAKDKRDTVKASKEMAKLQSTMAIAAQKAGIKNGIKPTKKQEQKMGDAIMQAMLPKIKQKLLSQEKVLRFGKECISNADTLKEANECNHKMNTMTSTHEEDFTSWSPASKKEILGFIEQGMKSMECAKKANSMADMKKCMPER